MNNDDIINALELTAKLMELHNENPFKTKAYTNASYKLSKLRFDFNGKTQQDIEAIEGVGKGISSKIQTKTSNWNEKMKAKVSKTGFEN